MSRTDLFGIGPPHLWADIQEIELEHEMIDPIAHEFMPPLPGYSELPSIKLGREIDRFAASAELRETISRRDRANLAFVYAVAFIAALGFLYAANEGLGRAEHQFKMDARR